jgi:hypothetical protein
MPSTIHPKERGQRSEAAVLHAFVRRGITVLQPFGDSERYYLVIEASGRFYRVQVKTGRLKDGRIQFATRSTGTHTRKVEKEGYEGEVDVFAAYSPEMERTYIVPLSEAPKTTMSLRVEAADKDSPNINWAEKFRLDCWLSQKIDSQS